jgi:lipopolysaccharide transport system ATP-binding protein
MSKPTIKVQGVGKWYRIEHDHKPKYLTLRDQISQTVTAPFRRKSKADRSDHENFVWALKDIDMEVHQGEVVGLIGPNGAGKSTLLKILTRITEPTTGSIDIRGRVGSLLEVGTGFHKELTGRDNVYLNGAILGMKRNEIDKKFDEIVSFAEVGKFIDTPVKFYSSGMTVRLAFAVAAHLEPEILLVDEVLAVGDASFQRKCLSKMETVGKEGRTIIFVSHHMPSITRLCERAILLDHGQLIMNGPSDQVVGDYLSSHWGTTAHKEWEDHVATPGNDIVRLCSVRIVNENGNTNFSFDIRKPIGIEMRYEVLRPGYALYPHFTVNNEEDILLFTSIDTDAEWRGKHRPPGQYTSTGWIPGNFLSEGTMIVSAMMRTEIPHMVHFKEEGVVAFQVIESPEGDSARVDYSGKFRGVVRPYLKWQTNYKSNGRVPHDSR